MFGFRFWQALFEGRRWARRQLLEGLLLVVVVLLLASIVKSYA